MDYANTELEGRPESIQFDKRMQRVKLNRRFHKIRAPPFAGVVQKKGLPFWGRPSPLSALPSARHDYRQQASICRQHSAKSPQQSLAANAKAEVAINVVPPMALKTMDRMLNS